MKKIIAIALVLAAAVAGAKGYEDWFTPQKGWDDEEAYVKQHGRCAICGCKLNSSRYTRFAGDHDHKTGELRGLLCTNCNTALGLFKDSIERLDSAKRYLIQYSSSHKDIV